MLKKLTKKRLVSDQETFAIIIAKIGHIRSKSDHVVICPGITGYNWMGVNRATFATFPDCTLELPQYYSNTIFSPSQLAEIVQTINKLNYTQVILSGFPEYFGDLSNALHRTGIKVKVLYHGFFSELSGNDQQQKQLNKLLQLSCNGIIHSIAFNKKGMAESINCLWNIPAMKVMLRTPEMEQVRTTTENNKIRIGILGNDQYRKNIHNQVVAAAMIPNAEIHVTTEQVFHYLPESINIVRHTSGMQHSEFIQLLAKMDINLHLSYSESWGQLTTESLSLGIPCLVAYHSDIYDYSEQLKQLMVVEEYDNSLAINERIVHILERRHSLKGTCKNYISTLNDHAERQLKKFLNA